MEIDHLEKHIISKLEKGLHFGLFDSGEKCFFEDGERVRYDDLWSALNILHNLPSGGHGKSLRTLCPTTYEGTFFYKFSKHRWRRQHA